MTTKISAQKFNEIMEIATKTRALYPYAKIGAITTFACSELEGRPDYDDIHFAVLYNLMGKEREN